MALLAAPLAVSAQTEEELVSRIRELEAKLAELRSGQVESAEVVADEAPSGDIVIQDAGGGVWTIGGAIRANYVLGDYDTGNGPGRGGNGGDFGLDTFRINAAYENGSWIGAAEYRFYSGYNFFHTLYGGYTLDDGSVVKAGLQRVPFGVGPYGPANSWFFDQHYYAGLADDMDLGVAYTLSKGIWTIDLGVYAAAQPNGRGSTKDSARYDYDIVDTGAPNAHYKERGQVNARAVAALGGPLATNVGLSLQAGRLEADDAFADDTIAYAASVHSSHSYGGWGLKAQITYYNYNPDYNGIDGSDDDLIAMGAYDYAAPVASEGWIPAVAVNYLWKTDSISWLDSINFYNDYSIIVKDGSAGGTQFNDSALNVIGMAFASGGWYIYVDYAFSNGNYFVGNAGDFGINLNNEWQKRFNVNFGYYF